MKYRVIFNYEDGIRRVTSTKAYGLELEETFNPGNAGYEFDSLESAKRATAKYVKVNQIREGSFIVVELPSYKIVSSFVFPPPPPLEGWVDVK